MVDHLPYVPGVGPWSEGSVWKLSARQEFPERTALFELLTHCKEVVEFGFYKQASDDYLERRSGTFSVRYLRNLT
jgi:hypothetical protein